MLSAQVQDAGGHAARTREGRTRTTTPVMEATAKETTSPEPTAALPKDRVDQFAEQGYLPPIRVLSPLECRRFLRAANEPRNPPPLDWYKGHAASSRAFYKIGTYPPIIDVVAALLGEDVMLWGASIVNRPPDAVHAWHTDI